MADRSVNQLATDVMALVPSFTVDLSGTPLQDLVYRKCLYCSNYTGLSIGSPNVQERFQSVVVDLTMAEILKSVALQGIKVASISLGDFSVNKGSSSAASDAANMYHQRAEEELSKLGRRTDFYVAY